MTKEHIGFAIFIVLAACIAGESKMDGSVGFDTGSVGFDTGSNGYSDFGGTAGCEAMATWFSECSEGDFSIEASIDDCMSQLGQITEDCDSNAAAAYSEGLEAAYSCYLELSFCGTEADISAHPDAIESCGALFDAQIAPYAECIYGAADIVEPPITQSEPEAIDFVEPIELRNVLVLEDDDYTQLELPFELSFFGERVQTLTITSNGLILVGAQAEDGCCFGLPIPQEDRLDGLIALGWGDLIPSTAHAIYWDVLGDAPNRELWISYDHLPSYSGPSNSVGARLRVIEGTENYDIFMDAILYDEPMTIGIEAPDGQYAVVKDGHSASSILVEKEAYRYTASVPQ